MRVVGFCGPGGEGESRFVARVRSAFPDAVRVAGGVGAAADGATEVFAEQPRPPLGVATRPGGSFLVVDGQIYGRAELDGSPLRAGVSFTVTLPDLLDEFLTRGDDAVQALDAAAIIAAWNADESRLTVTRDHSGYASVFYVQIDDGIAWSSDIESLIRLGHPFRLDTNTLDCYLADGWAPAPWTLAQGIEKIPPGHTLEWTPDHGARVHRYAPWPLAEDPTAEYSPTTLRNKLETAIQKRWPHQQRLGVLLSSGVDSLLTLAAARHGLDTPVDAYTFHFHDYEGEHNEGPTARRIADALGAHHHLITIGPEDLWNNLERATITYGGPVSWGVYSADLSQIAASGTQVLLNGMEPVVAITPRDAAAIRFGQYPRPIQLLGRLGAYALRYLAPTQGRRAAGVVHRPGNLAERSHAGDITRDYVRRHLYHDTTITTTADHAIADLYTTLTQPHTHLPTTQRQLAIRRLGANAELYFYWNHTWAQTHGMASGTPFTEIDLDRYIRSLPPHLYKNKQYLRQTAATYTGPELANTPVVSLNLPIAHWFRGPLTTHLKERLTKTELDKTGLFNHTYTTKLLNTHLKGHTDHAWTLLGIITTTTWLHHITNLPTPHT